MNVDITTVIIEGQLVAETDAWLSPAELCERCRLTPLLLTELVALGLVTPEIMEPDQWLFRTTVVPTLYQALRLRQELDLDWQGVALTMELLTELRALRQQVDSLQQQLALHNPVTNS